LRRNFMLQRRLYLLCIASCDICHPTLMTISTGGGECSAKV